MKKDKSAITLCAVLLTLVFIAIAASPCTFVFGQSAKHSAATPMACDTLVELPNSAVIKEGVVSTALLIFLITSLGFSSIPFLFCRKLVPVISRSFVVVLKNSVAVARFFNSVLQAIAQGIIHPKLHHTSVH